MRVNVALQPMIHQDGVVIPGGGRHDERDEGREAGKKTVTVIERRVSGAQPGFMTRAGRGGRGERHGSEALTPSDNNALFPCNPVIHRAQWKTLDSR